jgi:AcrR family transcriptional regulator
MPPRARSPIAGAAATNGQPGAPVARLAASQLKRMRRIVDTAVDLAEQGGFEAVRLRDVAERSDVALGTLYKYFRSKEDILLFALNEEVDRLEATLVERPDTSGTPRQRAAEFFRRSTRALARRPQLARAMVRAMASGDADTVMKLASLQLRIARLVTASMRGEAPKLDAPLDQPPGTAKEQAVAQILMNVWFSSLVGWAAGLHPERTVTEHVRTAAELVVAA